MRRFSLVCLICFVAPPTFAQHDVHDSVDDMPELVGGLASLQAHIRYPDQARNEGIEGRVMVQFVVDEGGNVIEPDILRGVHPSLDEAALAALSHVEFTPGRHRGRPAKVRMILPITFVLPDGTYSEEDVAIRVDEMPSIVGGLRAFMELLEYPVDAEERGIEGRVVISFVVNVEGEVESAEVVRPAHPFLDAAALSAVRKIRFTPGTKDGEAVRVRMALPVTFELPE